MKKIILIKCCLCFPADLYSQVGIGTKDVNPGIILQVESAPQQDSNYKGGILFPRVALTATNLFAPVIGTPTTGLMIFNTATNGSGTTAVSPGFYYWNNIAVNWQRVVQKNVNETALFANKDTSVDLNSDDSTFADLFANVRFNNNPTLYEKKNATTLQINEVGYYKVILNLDLASSGGADNFGVEILVNDASDIVSDNMYIPGRWDNEGGAEDNFPTGKSFVIYVPINSAGHTLKVRTYQLDPGTDVHFKNVNTSTISIEKIR
ncbi:hypothetical protein DRF65_27200 [Chryseobacterium pennae]|uniref:Uncharacterized protein n=1 Tax=Chryseobacterium pennae TaxID=2258962 RepID=A0A3D9C0D0_9FLAO|nr:hypothetical protein [Chryseobacterium pennae]REC59218.1 hypothetical protein DRF65_27200 [Chryseobacterium pennae]